MRAGLANLPMIVTMLPRPRCPRGSLKRFGHRIACLVGAILLAGALGGMAWGVEHGYVAIAASMVVMTIGLRTVMTICAVALVDAMPSNRTSIGAALNDTAQEVGTSVGTAVVGTLIAALVTTQLPAGTWSSALVASFFHGERITYAVLAVVVGIVAIGGALTLTDSRAAEEPVENLPDDVEMPGSGSTYVHEAPPQQPRGVTEMPRFMGFVRMEEGVGTPPQALFDAMDAHIGERAAKGVFLDGGGLYGTEDAVNFVVRAGEVTRVDGPYAEAKEVVGGWAIIQYAALEEAMADEQEFAELHAKHWPEVTVISTLRQISTGPEAPGD